MYRVIDFYKALSTEEKNQYSRGHFWWACYPYAHQDKIVRRYWPNRPEENLDIHLFDPSKENTDTVARTSPSEFLSVSKYKRRPVIILSTAGTPYVDRSLKGGDFFLVAPVRSLRDEITDEYRPIHQFVWGAITYKYSSVFYLPKSSEFDFHESVVHFDHMTTLHRSWLISPRSAGLTRDAMVCLNEWLRNYIYGKVTEEFNGNLEAYRQMVGNEPQIQSGLFGKII